MRNACYYCDVNDYIYVSMCIVRSFNRFSFIYTSIIIIIITFFGMTLGLVCDASKQYHHMHLFPLFSVLFNYTFFPISCSFLGTAPLQSSISFYFSFFSSSCKQCEYEHECACAIIQFFCKFMRKYVYDF